jgi:LysM repeat protein
MDTISRENNSSSYLPVAGVIVGLLALVLSAVALVKVSSMGKTFAEKLDSTESTANSAASSAQSAAASADKAQSDIKALHDSTQDGFNQVGAELGNIKGSIAKLEEAAKPVPRAAKGLKGGAAAAEGSAPGTVSADGTYTIKSGDSLAKIARANGVSLADLEAANSGVDPKHLKVGQKINLPAKK